MKDLNELKKNLLLSEWEEARDIFNAAASAGYSHTMAAALAYKGGFLAGKARQKETIRKVYKELAIAQERISVLESANAMQERITNPINNPVPNLEMNEVLAELDHNDKQPTHGEKQEDETDE